MPKYDEDFLREFLGHQDDCNCCKKWWNEFVRNPLLADVKPNCEVGAKLYENWIDAPEPPDDHIFNRNEAKTKRYLDIKIASSVP